MDPYSDYKPNQTKQTNPKPNQPKSPKDGRDGSSTEEAVSSPGRDYIRKNGLRWMAEASGGIEEISMC